jgi:hypothetical protein
MKLLNLIEVPILISKSLKNSVDKLELDSISNIESISNI